MCLLVGRTAYARSLPALLALLLSVALLPAGRPVAESAGGAPLLFVRARDVWIAHADGTGQRRLIRGAEAPCWSPDRKQIAFARAGNVWVARADGSGQRQVTALSDPHGWAAAPQGCSGRPVDIAWDLVDGLITFSRPQAFSVRQVGTVAGRPRPAGAAETLYTVSLFDVPAAARRASRPVSRWDPLDGAAGFRFSEQSHPAWSHDGKRLAFARNGDIWFACRGGARFDGDPIPPRGKGRWPAWRWEVARLAAVAHYDAPTYRVSREVYAVTHLSWAPDGRRLAYGVRRMGGTGHEQIHLLEVQEKDGFLRDGVDRTLATDGEDPVFSPDGRSIAYAAYGGDIVAVSLDGKTKRRLVRGGRQPAW